MFLLLSGPDLARARAKTRARAGPGLGPNLGQGQGPGPGGARAGPVPRPWTGPGPGPEQNTGSFCLDRHINNINICFCSKAVEPMKSIQNDELSIKTLPDGIIAKYLSLNTYSSKYYEGGGEGWGGRDAKNRLKRTRRHANNSPNLPASPTKRMQGKHPVQGNP